MVIKTATDGNFEELLEMKPMFRKAHPRLAKNLRTAFADDSLRDDIATGDVPSLRMKHLQLSMNLETLRNHWRETKVKGTHAKKRANLEEIAREKQKALVPAERWRERQRDLKALASVDENAAPDGTEEDKDVRGQWRERMKDTQWRVQQRLKYRLAEKLAEEQENASEYADGLGSTRRTGGGSARDTEGRSPGATARSPKGKKGKKKESARDASPELSPTKSKKKSKGEGGGEASPSK